MDCNEVSELLSAYIDGELGPEEAQLVASHLKFCSSCSEELAELKETIKLLHELPDLTPPPDFCSRVMAAIRTEAKKPIWHKIKLREWISFGAIAAAVLLFIASANVLSPFGTLPSNLEQKQKAIVESSAAPTEAEALAKDQAEILVLKDAEDEVSNALEVSGNDVSVKESKKVDLSGAKADSSKQGFKSKADSSGASVASKREEGKKPKEKEIINESTSSKELNISLQEYNSNGDQDLKDRGTDYRVRQALAYEAWEVGQNGADYILVLHAESKEQIGQEIVPLAYSLGGDVLSNETEYLEIAVPSSSLEAVIAAINTMGMVEVQKVSGGDVDQTLNSLKTKQESLLLEIKELEREITEVSSEEQLVKLKQKLADLYSNLKLTQLRLKTVANGKTILKIYFEYL